MQYFIWRIIRKCSKKVAAAAAGQRAPVRRGMVIGPQANHTALPGERGSHSAVPAIDVRGEDKLFRGLMWWWKMMRKIANVVG